MKKVVNCNSKNELIKTLKGYLKRLDQSHDTACLNDLFQELLLFQVSMDDLFDDYDQGLLKTDYILTIPEEESTLYYLLLHFSPGQGYDTTKKLLEACIQTIEDTLIEPQGERLTEDDIMDALKILEEKYSYGSYLLFDMPLPILMMEYSYSELMLAYLSRRTEKDTLEDAMIIFYGHDDCEISQKHALLHEFGHVLHSRITGTSDTIPESFHKIGKEVCIEYERLSLTGQAELFAECFSIAAANSDPEYMDNSLSLSDEAIEKLEKYFSELITMRG